MKTKNPVRRSWPAGQRVVFQPNVVSLAMYSSAPAQGTEGKVVSVSIGSKRVTYLPGPGGGLVYVDWDNLGIMGVSPIDLQTVKAKAKARKNPAPSAKNLPPDSNPVLTAAERRALPLSAFADPKNRRFPIHDMVHARAAPGKLNLWFKRGHISKDEYKEYYQRIMKAYSRLGMTAHKPPLVPMPRVIAGKRKMDSKPGLKVAVGQNPSGKEFLWKWHKVVGQWRIEREVSPETRDQWLHIFKKDEPKESFALGTKAPTKKPDGTPVPRMPKRKKSMVQNPTLTSRAILAAMPLRNSKDAHVAILVLNNHYLKGKITDEDYKDVYEVIAAAYKKYGRKDVPFNELEMKAPRQNPAKRHLPVIQPYSKEWRKRRGQAFQSNPSMPTDRDDPTSMRAILRQTLSRPNPVASDEDPQLASRMSVPEIGMTADAAGKNICSLSPEEYYDTFLAQSGDPDAAMARLEDMASWGVTDEV